MIVEELKLAYSIKYRRYSVIDTDGRVRHFGDRKNCEQFVKNHRKDKYWMQQGGYSGI